jgi:hypothetical protein
MLPSRHGRSILATGALAVSNASLDSWADSASMALRRYDRIDPDVAVGLDQVRGVDFQFVHEICIS